MSFDLILIHLNKNRNKDLKLFPETISLRKNYPETTNLNVTALLSVITTVFEVNNN